MPLPFVLASVYLVVNLALTIWIERERDADRGLPGWLVAAATILRWGPPIAALLYIEALVGDWLFLGFVVGFFALSFWLANRLLNFPPEPPKRRDRS